MPGPEHKLLFDFFNFNDKERLMKSLILSSLSKSQHQKEQMVGKVAKERCSQLCSCFDRISTIVSTAFLWFVATAFLPFFWPHLCVIISLFFLQSAKYLFGLNFSDAHICAAFDRNFTHCNYFHTFVLFRDGSKCFDRISSLGNYFYIFIRPM